MAVRLRRRDRRFAVWLVAIGLVAFALRVAYLVQIQGIPFFTVPVGDAASYLGWASEIAGGDRLGGRSSDQAPAYPYLLAVILKLVGPHAWMIRLAQALLGSLACAALGVAGARFFGRGAGLAAGVLMALYAPAVFFDGIVQKASLGLALGALLLLLLSGIHARVMEGARRPIRTALTWLGAGATLAVLALTRENALLWLVPVLFWLWLHDGTAAVGTRLGWTAAFVAGVAVLLLPVGLRNYRIDGTFAVTTVQAGPNFYIGNSEVATGRYVPLVRGHESPPFERADAEALASKAAGRALDPGEVSRFWWGRSWDFIRGHTGRWLALLGYKALLTWNAFEVPDTESYYLYTEWSGLLRLLGSVLHFGVLCPLAVMGVVLTWPRRRELWLLYLLVVTVTVSVAAFYVVARYRYPLVPFLALFAGAGLERAYAAFRTFQRRSIVPPLVAGFAAAVVVNWPINPERTLHAMAYQNLGTVLAQEGRLPEATAWFERAVGMEPDSVEVHMNLGMAYAVQNRFAEAVEHYRAALAIDAELMHAHYNLAVALEALGLSAEAAEQYRQALRVNPDDPDAHAALERLGR
ncbi:MAG: tetratricopeptide repeat protein [Phycisphaerae bacterium]|nr:tetratricopeptide repeat protein [Phycisphaerae bacterium]